MLHQEELHCLKSHVMGKQHLGCITEDSRAWITSGFHLVYGLALFLWQAVFDCLQVRHGALCNSKEALTGQMPQQGRVSSPEVQAKDLHTPSCPEIKQHGIN